MSFKRRNGSDTNGDAKKKQKSDGDSGSGEEFFELGGKKRCTVSTFKGRVLIGIREFYDADGEMKPGKKGMSLSVAEWEALKKLIPSVSAALKERGVAMPATAAAAAAGGGGGGDDDDTAALTAAAVAATATPGDDADTEAEEAAAAGAGQSDA